MRVEEDVVWGEDRGEEQQYDRPALAFQEEEAEEEEQQQPSLQKSYPSSTSLASVASVQSTSSDLVIGQGFRHDDPALTLIYEEYCHVVGRPTPSSGSNTSNNKRTKRLGVPRLRRSSSRRRHSRRRRTTIRTLRPAERKRLWKVLETKLSSSSVLPELQSKSIQQQDEWLAHVVGWMEHHQQQQQQQQQKMKQSNGDDDEQQQAAAMIIQRCVRHYQQHQPQPKDRITVMLEQFQQESEAITESFMVAWSMGHVLVPASTQTLKRAGVLLSDDDDDNRSWTTATSTFSKSVMTTTSSNNPIVQLWDWLLPLSSNVRLELWYWYQDTAHLCHQVGSWIHGLLRVLFGTLPTLMLRGITSLGQSIQSIFAFGTMIAVHIIRGIHHALSQWTLHTQRKCRVVLAKNPGFARLLRFIMVNIVVFLLLQSRKLRKNKQPTRHYHHYGSEEENMFRSQQQYTTSSSPVMGVASIGAGQDGYYPYPGSMQAPAAQRSTFRTGKNTVITIDAETLNALVAAAAANGGTVGGGGGGRARQW